MSSPFSFLFYFHFHFHCHFDFSFYAYFYSYFYYIDRLIEYEEKSNFVLAQQLNL